MQLSYRASAPVYRGIISALDDKLEGGEFMPEIQRRPAVTVNIGGVHVGSTAPVVVQSMTNTDTADVESTVQQIAALARAGSEMVRITVNNDDAAKAVPHIIEGIQKKGLEHSDHRRLPLQRASAAHEVSRCRKGALQVPHQPW